MKITNVQKISVKAILSIFLLILIFALSYYGSIVEFGINIASFGVLLIAIEAFIKQRNKNHRNRMLRKIGAIMISVGIVCVFFPVIAIISLVEAVYSFISKKQASIIWALSKSIFYTLGINIKEGTKELTRVIKSILSGQINPESRINIEYNKSKD